VLLFFSCFGLAQSNPLSAFEPLLNKTWIAQGEWGDGSIFKQQTTFTSALEGKIILAKSKGYVNKEQTEFGNRNHGIRYLDAISNTMKFKEFDVFGGLTEGEIKLQGKNISYVYNYGESIVTDNWEYVNDSLYNFKVGEFDGNSWKQVYLETQFVLTSDMPNIKDSIPNFKKLLVGSWSSKAWNGILKEKWSIGTDGHLQQTAQYFESGKLQYEAQNKIEIVGEDIILFTVIKNSNPKIFKATSYTENSITFQNSEYANPDKVVYYFKDAVSFERTISGTEKGKPTNYTFNFSKDE